jgi:hypothetical protein
MSKGLYKDKVCYYCGKVGHTKPYCFKRKRDMQQKQNHPRNGVVLMTSQENGIDNEKSEVWILDSGASNHICWNLEAFDVLNKLDVSITVKFANGQKAKAYEYGNVKFLSKLSSQETIMVTLTDVLYIPSAVHNLLSISQAMKRENCQTSFCGSKCQIILDGSTVIISEMVDLDGVYKFIPEKRNTALPKNTAKTQHYVYMQ